MSNNRSNSNGSSDGGGVGVGGGGIVLEDQQQNGNGVGVSSSPSLIQISEILQHSIELKLCSSISTHNVFWDTLLHNVETNGDVISLIISFLLTKYIQLVTMPDKRNTPLIQILIHILTLNQQQQLQQQQQQQQNLINTSSNNLNAFLINFNNNNNNNVNGNGSSNGDIDSSSDDEDDNEDDDNEENNQLNGNGQEINHINQNQNQINLNSSNGITMESIEEQIKIVQQQMLLQQQQPQPQQPLTPEDLKDIESMKTSILNTIMFISLFYNFNSQHPCLKVLHVKLAELKDNTNLDVVRILSPGFKDTNEYIFFLIDHCSDLDAITLPNQSTTSSLNSNNKITFGNSRNSWLNTCITMELQQSPTKLKMVLDNLFLFLKHPLLLEKRMLFFLQMLKHMLLVAPVFAPSALQSAMAIVKTYYLWPRPYCDFAREILELLSLEYRCPGTYFRTILAQEFPSINLLPTAASSTTLSSPVFSTKSRPNIHMLIDRYISEALSIQEIFESNYKNNIPSITQLQSNNISNIYQRIMGIDSVALGLEFLEPIDISQFHNKIVDLLNKSLYLEEEESKILKIKELGLIREEIVKQCGKNINAHYPQPINLPNLAYQFTSLYRYTIKNKKPDEYATQYQFPVYRKTSNTLINLLSNYNNNNNKINNNQDGNDLVKICIVGNDSSIHHLVGSYVYLCYHSPELFHDLDLQFYLIPAGNQTHLANFISSFDNWYFRQVSCVIKSLYDITPSFKPVNSYNSDQPFIDSMVNIREDRKSMISVARQSVSSKESDPTGSFFNASSSTSSDTQQCETTTPSSIILSEVEYLFREASFKLDIPLMKCECWVDDSIYHTIPFFGKVEFGFNSFILGTGDSTIIESPIGVKLNKYQPSLVMIKFAQVNPFGQFVQQQVIEHKTYYEVVIQNQIPKYHHQHPHQSSGTNNNGHGESVKMELAMTEYDSKKKRIIKSDQISMFNANCIEVESIKDDKKKPFDITVDGQLCGPYTKIKLSYCTINNDIITLPIMTFLPYY